MSGSPRIETEEEFHDRIAGLLSRARRNGVDVEGSWDCRPTPEPVDYEVLITEVVARPPGD